MVLCAETDEGDDFCLSNSGKKNFLWKRKIPVNSLILFRAKKEEKLHASEATSLIRVGRADRMASDPAADGAKRLIRFFK